MLTFFSTSTKNEQHHQAKREGHREDKQRQPMSERIHVPTPLNSIPSIHQLRQNPKTGPTRKEVDKLRVSTKHVGLNTPSYYAKDLSKSHKADQDSYRRAHDKQNATPTGLEDRPGLPSLFENRVRSYTQASFAFATMLPGALGASTTGGNCRPGSVQSR